MAAKVGEEVVKAPGTLVVSVYAGCPDISLTVTPDIKHAGRSSLVFVDLSGGHARLGGSALAQTFKQLGDASPDCDTALLKRAFRATQRVLRERMLLAGHDRADGGLLTTVLEMSFGGECGCVMEATTENSVMEFFTSHDHLRGIPLLLTVGPPSPHLHFLHESMAWSHGSWVWESDEGRKG